MRQVSALQAPWQLWIWSSLSHELDHHDSPSSPFSSPDESRPQCSTQLLTLPHLQWSIDVLSRWWHSRSAACNNWSLCSDRDPPVYTACDRATSAHAYRSSWTLPPSAYLDLVSDVAPSKGILGRTLTVLLTPVSMQPLEIGKSQVHLCYPACLQWSRCTVSLLENKYQPLISLFSDLRLAHFSIVPAPCRGDLWLKFARVGSGRRRLWATWLICLLCVHESANHFRIQTAQ